MTNSPEDFIDPFCTEQQAKIEAEEEELKAAVLAQVDEIAGDYVALMEQKGLQHLRASSGGYPARWVDLVRGEKVIEVYVTAGLSVMFIFDPDKKAWDLYDLHGCRSALDRWRRVEGQGKVSESNERKANV